MQKMCPLLYLNGRQIKDIFDKIKKPETHMRLQLSHDVTIHVAIYIKTLY
ncbi:hypothetical protein ICW_02972 [Bacillus wiedmannii]|nr:hypothetical protein ICW_02972 [Bacillus wiedmannii]EJV65092.1 hypothetical protein IEO_02188 [Bacillus wiedmannii]OFD08475.1 hypothetical protein BTGOE6_20480 [Bacillus wiedmannii]